MIRNALPVTLAALLVMSMFAVAPAAAASSADDCGMLVGLIGCDDGESMISIDSMMQYVDGLSERAKHAVSSALPFSSSASDAKQSADDAQYVFNENSEDFVAHANSNIGASEEYDVIRVTFEEDGARESKYLVSTVDENGVVTQSEVVDDTDRLADTYVVLTGAASANAADELEDYHSEYASVDEVPENTYFASLAGKYGGDVYGPLVDDLR